MRREAHNLSKFVKDSSKCTSVDEERLFTSFISLLFNEKKATSELETKIFDIIRRNNSASKE